MYQSWSWRRLHVMETHCVGEGNPQINDLSYTVHGNCVIWLISDAVSCILATIRGDSLAISTSSSVGETFKLNLYVIVCLRIEISVCQW